MYPEACRRLSPEFYGVLADPWPIDVRSDVRVNTDVEVLVDAGVVDVVYPGVTPAAGITSI